MGNIKLFYHLKENTSPLRINRKGQKCHTTNHIGGKNKKDEK